MTNAEFYKRLRRLRTTKTWRAVDGEAIRTTGNQCPLTAVCQVATGERLSTSEYIRAGALLGMRQLVVQTIAEAADISDPKWCSPAVQRHRKRMKKALAL